MKIAILSGKGGTGKTFVSVNLAFTQKCTYIDCDVEAPNGCLFLKPQHTKVNEVFKELPYFDMQKCTACKMCIDFCRFNALAFVQKPILFDEICHSCGGCKLVCPSDAITYVKKSIGVVEIGDYKGIKTITGRMNIGEASGVPIIKCALDTTLNSNYENIIIDCPPGSACTVVESIADADYCVVVLEPTIFGLHNAKMVIQLAKLMNKKIGIVINKCENFENQATKFCEQDNLDIIAQLPYDKNLCCSNATGIIASENFPKYKLIFEDIANKIREKI